MLFDVLAPSIAFAAVIAVPVVGGIVFFIRRRGP